MPMRESRLTRSRADGGPPDFFQIFQTGDPLADFFRCADSELASISTDLRTECVCMYVTLASSSAVSIHMFLTLQS